MYWVIFICHRLFHFYNKRIKWRIKDSNRSSPNDILSIILWPRSLSLLLKFYLKHKRWLFCMTNWMIWKYNSHFWLWDCLKYWFDMDIGVLQLWKDSKYFRKFLKFLNVLSPFSCFPYLYCYYQTWYNFQRCVDVLTI